MDAKTLEYMQQRVTAANAINDEIKRINESIARIDVGRRFEICTRNQDGYSVVLIKQVNNELSSVTDGQIDVAAREAIRAALVARRDSLGQQLAEI